MLERCGVRCEVLGFTTRDWDGGDRTGLADGYLPDPGRLNALEHIVIKAADVAAGCGAASGSCCGRPAEGEHRRRGALTGPTSCLLARPERRRIRS
ncbi:MAG: hypothetical protein R2712_02605 [Vicinamibacterales bacterium]